MSPAEHQDPRPPADEPLEADEAQTRPDESPTEQVSTQETTTPTSGGTPAEIFAEPEVERFRVEWQQIQARFVDDPREAVQSADQLVDEVMQSLANHKQELESQWQQGSETEDLRLALQRYRTLFNQLLNV